MIKILKENSYDADRKFKQFNNEFFNGELKKLDIIFVNKKSEIGGRAYLDKIEINSHHFDTLNDRQKDSLLVHEMVHVWVDQKGLYNSKNIHKGEFLRKAKEIESKSNLTVVGTVLQVTADDFESLEKEDVYLYMLGYDSKLSIHNFNKIYVFDDYKNSYVEDIKKGKLRYNDNYLLVYKVTINTPILEKKYIEKIINNTNYYFESKANQQIVRAMKKFPQYVEKIDIIELRG